jgi:hypothetical protein
MVLSHTGYWDVHLKRCSPTSILDHIGGTESGVQVTRRFNTLPPASSDYATCTKSTLRDTYIRFCATCTKYTLRDTYIRLCATCTKSTLRDTYIRLCATLQSLPYVTHQALCHLYKFYVTWHLHQTLCHLYKVYVTWHIRLCVICTKSTLRDISDFVTPVKSLSSVTYQTLCHLYKV